MRILSSNVSSLEQRSRLIGVQMSVVTFALQSFVASSTAGLVFERFSHLPSTP